jgi:hypothetical protein
MKKIYILIKKKILGEALLFFFPQQFILKLHLLFEILLANEQKRMMSDIGTIWL